MAPPLADELSEIQDALADAAQSFWPDWYATAEKRFSEEQAARPNMTELAVEVGGRFPGASGSWLRQAWKLCERGQRPVLESMAATEQVRQLSLAIDPSRLIFALSVESESATPARIRGIARAAEWLAQNSEAKVLLLLPGAWTGDRELDHVNYGATTLAGDETPAPDNPPPESQESQHPTVVVGRLVGKPHPMSEVEQTVCRHLLQDPELSPLFEWNQRLESYGHKHYIVDLIWRHGKLIIEFDGPGHHSHMSHVKDRDRDYRFLMKGYTTLRIPNDEVFTDVDRVLEKIRNVVLLRQASAKGVQPS